VGCPLCPQKASIGPAGACLQRHQWVAASIRGVINWQGVVILHYTGKLHWFNASTKKIPPGTVK